MTTDYITLTRRCNELLQAIIHSKSIAFEHAAPNFKRDGPDCSINNNFVHIVLHILRENRNLEIANKSDLEIASMQVEQYLKKKEFLAEKGSTNEV
jgi:triphosphoribosyl-dephospho-CoA synthetase